MKFKKRIAVERAKFGYRSSRWLLRNATKLELAVWLVVATATVIFLPTIQSWVALRLDNGAMDDLQAFALTVGGAMIGATAIASSFVLFAMQVNVERLPYGLFRRFSSDRRLLSTFATSFFVAIGGAALSLISDFQNAAMLITFELFTVALVLRLLLLAYGRSFELVSPLNQLESIYSQTDNALARFERHLDATSDVSTEQPDNILDAERRAILDSIEGWDRPLQESIESVVAFARRSGLRGDFQISASALATVVKLNSRYIQIKGRTFFANNLLMDNPLVSDGTINQTLEALRRLQEAAVARKDEVQIEQIFSTFAALAGEYARINYGPSQSKSHAFLATGYLERGIESCIPHQLVDCTMHGVRMLGNVAKQFVVGGCSAEAANCASKMTVFGLVGAASDKHRPITVAVMEELRDISILLLRSSEQNIGFAIREIHESAAQIATAILQLPDNPLTSLHSSYLAPYFSSTSFNSVRSQMTSLVNALAQTNDEETANLVIGHISIWADGIYKELKNLLLKSIEKQSHFCFDVIHWITGITELLIFVSNSSHIRPSMQSEIRNHALWLFGSITWIPRDKDSTAFVENLSLRQEVFQTALISKRDGWEDGFEAAWKFLLDWAVSAGRHQNGWGVLDRWLEALAALALWNDSGLDEKLKNDLEARLEKDDAPLQQIRDASARNLRRSAEAIREREFEMDLVKRIITSNDREKTQKLLNDLANILSPDTAGEPINPAFL